VFQVVEPMGGTGYYTLVKGRDGYGGVLTDGSGRECLEAIHDSRLCIPSLVVFQGRVMIALFCRRLL
jgi:hypothetical protein